MIKIRYCALVLILILSGCNNIIKKELCSGKVNIKGKEESGTFIIRCTGYGNNFSMASDNAQYNTFYKLLFTGLPGTELSKPFLENEREAKKMYPDYFKLFFNQSGYLSFVMWSTISSIHKTVNGKFMATIEIKINYNALKKNLEDVFILPKTNN